MSDTVLTVAALTIAGLALLGGLAVGLARLKDGRRIGFLLLAGLSFMLAGCGLAALIGGAGAPGSGGGLALPFGLPFRPTRLRLDALSAFMMLIINVPIGLTALYAIGYLKGEPAGSLRQMVVTPIFAAAMNLVLLADDAFAFLFGWEVMSVASWLLVLTYHEKPEVRRAGQVYLAMAMFGTLALLLGFGVLSWVSGDYVFQSLRETEPKGALAHIAVLLAIIGAGSKAGLVPLHVWLPAAHPAAPTPVSALMSGAMTKVALYGLIRLLFDLGPDAHWAWGLLLVTLGAGGAVLALLRAFVQYDLKALLAYSTVENIGLILMLLGLAIIFRFFGLDGIAALSMIAALLHMANHALAKTLMFGAAGAVIQAAHHERDLRWLGGLIGKVPRIATLMLIGAASLAAVPPLNGFIAEWLAFQAILSTPGLPEPLLRLTLPAAAALLALSAALAAAVFVRACGMVLLGQPRSPHASRAHPVDGGMLAPLMILAGLCVAIGLLPGLTLQLTDRVAEAVIGAIPQGAQVGGWLKLAPPAGGESGYSGLALVLAALPLAVLLVWGLGRWARRAPARRGPAWGCGHEPAGPIAQYGPGSFAQPMVRAFAPILAARESVKMPPPGDSSPARHRIEIGDHAWQCLYAPVLDRLTDVTARINPLQFRSIHAYLTYMFAALIGLLLLVVLI